jgi:hypothetical protein
MVKCQDRWEVRPGRSAELKVAHSFAIKSETATTQSAAWCCSGQASENLLAIIAPVALLALLFSRGGEIGRRARLRIWSRKRYRFESVPRQVIGNKRLTQIK